MPTECSCGGQCSNSLTMISHFSQDRRPEASAAAHDVVFLAFRSTARIHSASSECIVAELGGARTRAAQCSRSGPSFAGMSR
jgi:hypothetical protein